MDLTDILIIIINFAGSIGVFLFGMKLMSEGLQKFAGRGMRHIMGKITGNPLSGILVGTLIIITYLGLPDMLRMAIYLEVLLGSAQNLINVISNIVTMVEDEGVHY